MNTIKFILQDYAYGLFAGSGQTAKGVDIYIDGKNLIDIVREVVFPVRPDMADSYCGIIADEFFQYFDDISNEYNYILGCGCGDVGCWPLEVQITKNEHIVVWQNFSNYHLEEQEWNWAAMPVFTFDTQQYNFEVENLRKNITN